MTAWRAPIAILSAWTLAIWLGGFTVYSAVVIPVLHRQLGSPLEVGLVTQEVTDVLNGIGAIALGVAWLDFLVESRSIGLRGTHDTRTSLASRLGLASLVLATATLCALVALHERLDWGLESGDLTNFYEWHRAYLWTSIVQWLAGLAIVARTAIRGDGE